MSFHRLRNKGSSQVNLQQNGKAPRAYDSEHMHKSSRIYLEFAEDAKLFNLRKTKTMADYCL